MNAAGDCASSVGAYVVVNADGWVLTAKHIVDAYTNLGGSRQSLLNFEAEVEASKQDQNLTRDQRDKAIRKKGNPNRSLVRSFSYWWGRDNWRASEIHVIAEADLALVKLADFDPSQIARYPTFKDPSKEIAPGTSLCRLGFPFNEIKPTYDAATGRFALAALEPLMP